MTTTSQIARQRPATAGAVKVCEWDDMQFGIEDARRYFVGSKRVIEREGPSNGLLIFESADSIIDGLSARTGRDSGRPDS
jgi:hypothetical protein